MPTGPRPGKGVYVKNEAQSAAITHNRPAKEGNFVGVAVKQRSRGFDSKIADQTVIDDDENYFLITKGKILIPFVSGCAKGDRVYITDANAITKTQAGNTPFGTVTEIPGERGTPTGKMWVDLDLKIDLDVS